MWDAWHGGGRLPPLKSSAPLSVGTASGMGHLVGPGLGREQRKRPCRQVGVSAAVISALASCQPCSFLLCPRLKLSVFDVRELRRAQPALYTVTILGNASSYVLKLKQDIRKSFSLVFRGWWTGTCGRGTEKDQTDRQTGMANNSSLDARHCSKHIMYILSFNRHSTK